jgi:uncharacterized protein
MDVTGIGIGLRMELASDLLARKPDEIEWLELHPENYLRRGGRYASVLAGARARYPVVTHGLTMCFGSVEPHEPEYLGPLARFLADLDVPWHSDHLCFAGAEGALVHDLLPMPFNEEAIGTVVSRFEEARGALDRELAIENVSFYAPSKLDEMDEPSFIAEILARTDGKLLLDVNNVYVNSRNFGFDPRTWIDRVDPKRVVQIHVAGHLVRPDGFRIDTHGEPVCNDVYELLEYTLERIGPRPVLLERDGNFPTLDSILEEVRRLRELYDRAAKKHAARAEPSLSEQV